MDDVVTLSLYVRVWKKMVDQSTDSGSLIEPKKNAQN